MIFDMDIYLDDCYCINNKISELKIDRSAKKEKREREIKKEREKVGERERERESRKDIVTALK